MQNPRTRLLSLRMTEEEYDRLRSASDAHGARSLSDFARNVLLTEQRSQAPGECCCQRLSELDQSITRVELNVAQLLERAVA